jgi:hypothetical protein
VNNIKKSSVSREENISKKTGQKSSKYGEFIKKPNFCGWGKARQRATHATPHPTASRIRGVYTWKKHDSRMRTRNPYAELVGTRRKGGGNNAKLNNSSTIQHFDAIFQTKIDIPFFLLIALTKCSYLLLASLASKNRVLYSKGRACKRVPELAVSPQSTTLHSTGNTSVKKGVSRTKSATTTHVEQ